jgi:hypothetical protein
MRSITARRSVVVADYHEHWNVRIMELADSCRKFTLMPRLRITVFEHVARNDYQIDLLGYRSRDCFVKTTQKIM